jgi:hypothetical protein
MPRSAHSNASALGYPCCCRAAAGLLRTLTMHLTSSLVKLDMGVVRITCEEALEGITQLNRLTDLRLAVTVRALLSGAQGLACIWGGDSP